MEPGFYPELGEPNEQVYGTLGLAAEMLSDLKNKGVI